MRRAGPHELTDPAVPIITARLTEAELMKWMPVHFDAVDDPLQTPEPSLAALVQLDAGAYVVLNYGKESEQLTVEFPVATKDRTTLLAEFFREVPLPLSRVLWHEADTFLPDARADQKEKQETAE